MESDWNRNTLTCRLPIYGACVQAVSDIESLDGGKFREALNRFLGRLVVDMEVGSPSLASLSELKHCLFEPSKQVVQLMHACEGAMMTNPDLFDFVTDYVESCGMTLHICDAIDMSICRARYHLSSIDFALKQFEEDAKLGRRKQNYETTLRALKEFTALGNDPFRVDFSELLESVCEMRNSWFVRMKDKKSKLDNKFVFSKAWRSLVKGVVLVSFASVMVCAVLAMPQPFLTALAEAAAAMVAPLAGMDGWMSSVWKKYEKIYEKEVVGQSEIMGSTCFWARVQRGDLDNIPALVSKWEVEMESMLQNDGLAPNGDEWIHSLWNKHEKELKLQTQIMSKSYFWTPVGESDLDNIRALVDKFEVEMESMLLNDGFASRDETAVMLAMNDLKKKLSEFMKTVKDLDGHAVDCRRDVAEWRDKFLRMMGDKRRNK